jgi:hypothetical protein
MVRVCAKLDMSEKNGGPMTHDAMCVQKVEEMVAVAVAVAVNDVPDGMTACASAVHRTRCEVDEMCPIGHA